MRRLAILLTAAAICLAPGCSHFNDPYDGPRFPPGTECRPYGVIPQGLIVVCFIPTQGVPDSMPEPYEGDSLDAS